MHQNIDNIKIIKLVNGDDIVCVLPTGKDQLDDKSPLIRIIKPLQIKYVPQITTQGIRDYIALTKWAGYTPDIIMNLPKDKILTITRASEEMVKSYHHIAKSYEKQKTVTRNDRYDQRQLTDEQNEELNEIWDEFADEPKTIH